MTDDELNLAAAREEAAEYDPADSFADSFLDKTERALRHLDTDAIDAMAQRLATLREFGGRLWLVGNGGGAGHCSHAAADFRKLCRIDAFCVSDNVPELTARSNDEGWDSSYIGYLSLSLRQGDALLVVSVGGGDSENHVSQNLVNAMDLAYEEGASVLAIIGRDGGYAAKAADCCVLIPVVDQKLVTPISEGLQSVVLHLLASHPVLKVAEAKWEGLAR